MTSEPETSQTPPADYRAVPNWSGLLTRPEFPILEDTRQRVHHALRDKQVNFNDLAPVVERDPALCLNLQILTVYHNPECLHQISGAANCLSLLGMQELVKMIKQLPVISNNTTDERQLAYRTALHSAQMAGHISAWLSSIKGNNSQHYARWASMMVAAPLWAWLLADDQARNLLYFASRHFEPWHALQRLSGQHLRQWQTLVRKLALPPLAADCWNPVKWPSLYQWRLLRRHDPWDLPDKIGRPLLHSCQQPHLTPILANTLAWHLHTDPQGSFCQRWLTLTAHWMGKPRHSWQHNLRDIQMLSSEQQHSAFGSGVQHWLNSDSQPLRYPWITPPRHAETSIDNTTQTARHKQLERSRPSTFHPHSTDLLPEAAKSPALPLHAPTREIREKKTQPQPLADPRQHPQQQLQKQPQEQSQQKPSVPAPESAKAAMPVSTRTAALITEPATPAATSALAAKQTPAAKPELSALQRRLHNDPGSFTDWHQLMQALLHGLREDVGLPWAAVMLLSKDKSHLRLVYTEGLAEHSPVRNLQIDVRSLSLFSKLLEHPAGILVSPDTRERLLRNLPETIRQALPPFCLLMSIHAGAKPIGVVISGTNPGQTPPDTATWTAFKGLCQSGSSGLTQLAQASAKRKA
jgi:hypothetical protein